MRWNLSFPIWVILSLILTFSTGPTTCHAWEWSDLAGGGEDVQFATNTLTMSQVSAMRVRDIKRRLSRSHGYSADELGAILDKKELIQMLSFEEHKVYSKEQEKLKRYLLIRGSIFSIVAIVVVACWPVLHHLWEVAMVNLVVYTDRKKHEASRCWELRSIAGAMGIIAMAILDVLQVWLSVSVMLSWFMRSRYFFPTPDLPIKPGQLMGGNVAKSKAANYGLNVGPMVLTWGMRFIYDKTLLWTGQAFARAHRQQRKVAREWESPEQRVERKAARKAAKRAAKDEAEQLRQEKESEEVARRRKVTDAATAQLFPPYMVQQYKQQQHLQQDISSDVAWAGEDGEDIKVEEEDDESNTGEDYVDPIVSEQIRKEFQEQVEALDMDELD